MSLFYVRCIIRRHNILWNYSHGALGRENWDSPPKLYAVYGFMAFYIHSESISLKLCLEALGLSFCATLVCSLLRLESLWDRVSESANCIFLSLTCCAMLCMRCIA
jgi:hypothetical protein